MCGVGREQWNTVLAVVLMSSLQLCLPPQDLVKVKPTKQSKCQQVDTLIDLVGYQREGKEVVEERRENWGRRGERKRWEGKRREL